MSTGLPGLAEEPVGDERFGGKAERPGTALLACGSTVPRVASPRACDINRNTQPVGPHPALPRLINQAFAYVENHSTDHTANLTAALLTDLSW